MFPSRVGFPRCCPPRRTPASLLRAIKISFPARSWVVRAILMCFNYLSTSILKTIRPEESAAGPDPSSRSDLGLACGHLCATVSDAMCTLMCLIDQFKFIAFFGLSSKARTAPPDPTSELPPCSLQSRRVALSLVAGTAALTLKEQSAQAAYGEVRSRPFPSPFGAR